MRSWFLATSLGVILAWPAHAQDAETVDEGEDTTGETGGETSTDEDAPDAPSPEGLEIEAPAADAPADVPAVPTAADPPAPETPAAPTPEKKKSELSVSFTTDTEARWLEYDARPLLHVDGPAPSFFEIVGRQTMRLHKGKFGFDLQMDEVVFIGIPHTVDGEKTSEPPSMVYGCGLETCISNPISDAVYANPEKFAFTYTSPELNVTVGDFYGAFGYGLALNVNRNVDIDVDTSIQGGRIVARPGDWEITGLAGMMNRQQVFQDLQNVRALRGDQRHLLAAVRAERFNLGPASVGAHAVMVDYVRGFGLSPTLEEAGTQPDAIIGGATLALYGVGGVDVAIEADGYSYPTDTTFQASEERQPGYGIYGQASFGIGATLWQIEAKRYKNVYRLNNPVAEDIYVMVAPPTLEYERAINPDTSAVTGSNDIWGLLARTDILAGDVMPYVAVGFARDMDLVNAAQHAPTPENIVQAQAGVEYLAEHFALLANAVGRMDLREDGLDPDRQIYGDLDIKMPLVKKTHTNIVLFGQYFVAGPDDQGFVYKPWGQLSASVTLLPSPDLGLTIFGDYNDNPIAAGDGLFGEAGYGAAELFWKPTSAWTLKAFYGGYAAGIRCSGGQCRTVPAFTGARLAATGAF